MSPTTIGTIETILENVIESTDDPEINFKLRQALQLLVFVEEQQLEVKDTLEDAEFGDDVRENLRELGYIE